MPQLYSLSLATFSTDAIFLLPAAPANPSSVQVFLNGLLQVGNYAFLGNQLILQVAVKPTDVVAVVM